MKQAGKVLDDPNVSKIESQTLTLRKPICMSPIQYLVVAIVIILTVLSSIHGERISVLSERVLVLETTLSELTLVTDEMAIALDNCSECCAKSSK